MTWEIMELKKEAHMDSESIVRKVMILILRERYKMWYTVFSLQKDEGAGIAADRYALYIKNASAGKFDSVIELVDLYALVSNELRIETHLYLPMFERLFGVKHPTYKENI